MTEDMVGTKVRIFNRQMTLPPFIDPLVVQVDLII